MEDLQRKRLDVTVVLIVFIALAIGGMAAAGFFVRDYAMARGSASWPEVTGVILSRLDSGAPGLRYAYSYEGRSYESNRRRVFTARFMKPQTRVLAPGDSVTVYVNPKKPDFSVLQPGGAGAAFVFFSILSGLCVFFGVGGVVWALSEAAAEERAQAA